MKRFCGIDIEHVLSVLRKDDQAHRMVAAALGELLMGDLLFHVLQDDGFPARHYCLLVVGKVDDGYLFAKLEGPTPPGTEREMPVGLIRHVVGLLPDGPGGDGKKLAVRLRASPHRTAAALLIGETRGCSLNAGFCHHPVLEKTVAAVFLRRYLKTYLDERLKQN